MEPIKLITKLLFGAALMAGIWSCSSENSSAPSLDANGKHPELSVWYIEHRMAFANYPQQCTQCHGTDLKGGIANVNCFAGIQGLPGFPCHSNGHPPRFSPHAVPFKDSALHGPAAKADLVYCQSCHGTSGGPGSNPRFNITIGTMTNGCEDCHVAKAAHPPVTVVNYSSNWKGHSSAGNMANACVLCHGVTLGGGAGPACNSCHDALPSGVIPAVGSCDSCHVNGGSHGNPPVSGSHTAHNALSGVTGKCGTCHFGAGSGSSKHDNGIVDLSISSEFSAKGGTAAVNPDNSCANILCHGGVTTPVWGGSIDPAVDCIKCHLKGTAFQTPQYNSYFSGQHTKHLNEIGLVCTDCHDMSVTSNGASHFSGFGTPVFELSPALTIKVPGYPTCNPTKHPPAGAYSVGVCHGPHSWQ